MTDPDDDRYLWDREGSDPDVASLERLLSPLAHRARPAVSLAPAPAPARRRRFPAVAAAAAVLVVAGAVAVVAHLASGGARDDRTAPGSGKDLLVAGEDVRDGEWVSATEREREVSLGDVGRLRLAVGTELRLERLSGDVTRFFLRRGEIEASISASARPRFFQVDTSAARCVDLGCRYTLSVDDVGVAHVRVTTGQVSFETDDREVYVPAGARCTARPATGPDTPRFDDAPPALVQALDAFDAARAAERDRRVALADRVLAEATTPRDALATWHLLQDRDDDVARRAAASLASRFGEADDPPPSGERPSPAERERWKERLSVDW